MKFYILENEKNVIIHSNLFKFTIISKFYILENEKILLFINNFFNIKKEKEETH